jgi:hypothetical protein
MGLVVHFAPQQEMACLGPAFGPRRIITYQISLSTNELKKYFKTMNISTSISSLPAA